MHEAQESVERMLTLLERLLRLQQELAVLTGDLISELRRLRQAVNVEKEPATSEAGLEQLPRRRGRRSFLRPAIIEYIKSRGGAALPGDIVRGVLARVPTSEQSIRQALSAMAKSGELVRTLRGYEIVDTGSDKK